MQKKVNLAMLALFSCSLAMAQNEKTDQNIAQGLDENAFTFSEAQLGEDDDMSSNVTILNSTSNVYASQQVTCSRQHVSAIVPSTRSTTMSISTVLP